MDRDHMRGKGAWQWLVVGAVLGAAMLFLVVNHQLQSRGGGAPALSRMVSGAYQGAKDAAALAPEAPTSLVIGQVTESSISLSWKAVTNAKGYRVYWRTTPADPDRTLEVSEPNATVSNLPPGTSFDFWVQAFNAAGESAPSPHLFAVTISAPATPTGVVVNKVTESSVSLSWQPVANARGYRVLWQGSPTRPVEVTEPNVTISDLPSGTSFEFWIHAFNMAGDSPSSSHVPAVTYWSWDEIQKLARPGVVRISTYTSALGALGGVSAGTGFYVRTPKLSCAILTDWHVVQNSYYYIDISVPDSPSVKSVAHARVVATSTNPDLALLTRDDGGCGTILSPGTDSPKPGDEIGVLGSPAAQQLTFTQGKVTSDVYSGEVRGLGLQSRLFAFDAAALHGSSGSPIFNHYGSVVGVMECLSEQTGNRNCATDLSAMNAFLQAH